MLPRILIVGIGSHHGDDRFGWLVAELLTKQITERDLIGQVAVRLAQSPSELLDWLDGVERLVICDAYRDAARGGTILHWNWPSEDVDRASFGGTHDLGLPEALDLVAKLGRLPKQTEIWSAAGRESEPNAPVSLQVAAAAEKVARRIAQEIDVTTSIT